MLQRSEGVENLKFTMPLTLNLVYPTISSIIRRITLQNCIQQQHDTRFFRFISIDFNANLLFDSRGEIKMEIFLQQSAIQVKSLLRKKTFANTPSTTRIFHFHNRLINAKGMR